MELFNLQAEEAILGTIIMNNDYLLRVSDVLEDRHFYSLDNQKIYKHLLDSQIISNQVTLKGFFDTLEAKNYLSHLLGSASMIVDIRDYAQIVIKLWQSRELINFCKRISPTAPYDETAAGLSDLMAELSIATAKKGRMLVDVVKEVLTSENHLIKTGFSNIDEMLCGIPLKSLVILGGKSGMGKTTFAINLALKQSEKMKVIFFSVEVSDMAIATKAVTQLCSIDHKRLKNKSMTSYELESLDSVDFKKFGFLLEDAAGLTIGRLRSKIKRHCARHDIKAVYVDFLQIITPEVKSFNREQEISKIVIGLKEIAKEFNIVVFALSQLSRGSDSRANHRPILSDLRDSGSVEQLADIVAFVHREEYYVAAMKPSELSPEFSKWQALMNEVKGFSKLIIAKNRDGEIGDLNFKFDGAFSRFT